MAGPLLPICATFFSMLLCIAFYCKKRINLFENRVYGTMLICIVIDSIIASLLQVLAIICGNNISLILLNALNKLDFLFLIIYCNFIFIYTILITYPNINSKKRKVITFTVVIDVIFYFLILFSNIDIINEGHKFSISGISVIFALMTCGVYIFLSLLITFINIKNISKKHIPILSIIAIVGFLIVIFQINPYLIIVSITLTFINYIMFFTIENPDVRLIEQLEIAKMQADKANRAKTEFLSSMSHEIRTPLNAISGFSNCILDAQSLDEAKENAKDIVDASDTLLDIVNGILDISKIEAGKLEIVNSPYNAPDTFRELAKLITPKMKEKGLFFTYYIAPDLPKTLLGDHANLKKVVTNLLSNAYKYTKTGFVKYEVNCVNLNGYTRLVISVEDSGQGIKKENINKLFTRFQRLEEDKNTTIEGTGLGLAITKQLVELMGGKIIVHSIYGTGSKFTVVLNQKIETEAIVEEPKYKTTLNLSDVRILIVDDNPLNLKVATKLLQRHNANNIKTCESGFECINKIGNGEVYDVILLDDMMPKMSGVETLHKLKGISGFNVPVIALTANAITGMKEHYLAEGFNNYLAKPIQDDELIRTMNEVLGRLITEQIPTVKISNKKDENQSDKNEIIPVSENDLEELESKLDTSTNIVEKNNNADVEMLDEVSDVDKESDSFVYDIEYLKNNNIDVDGAIETLGDIETYNMTISAYLDDSDDLWKKINEYKNSNNMDDYAIEVHALKSSSRYIGLTKLGDIAYQHELKSKENDIDYITSHFSELDDEYNKNIVIVKNYVKYNNL